MSLECCSAVVIVATEEALASVPRNQREASLALGATRWQTLWNVVIPGAMPGILTGLILAMARGAGEVAPLMLTGRRLRAAGVNNTPESSTSIDSNGRQALLSRQLRKTLSEIEAVRCRDLGNRLPHEPGTDNHLFRTRDGCQKPHEHKPRIIGELVKKLNAAFRVFS